MRRCLPGSVSDHTASRHTPGLRAFSMVLAAWYARGGAAGALFRQEMDAALQPPFGTRRGVTPRQITASQPRARGCGEGGLAPAADPIGVHASRRYLSRAARFPELVVRPGPPGGGDPSLFFSDFSALLYRALIDAPQTGRWKEGAYKVGGNPRTTRTYRTPCAHPAPLTICEQPVAWWAQKGTT